MIRARLADVARASGVSPATVDRVLNNRAGVHSRTRAVVLMTARRLGYLPDDSPPAAAGAPDALRLVFGLPAGTNVFMDHLSAQIAAQAADRPGLTVRIDQIAGLDPLALAAWIDALGPEVQGAGLLATDHSAVRTAIRAAVARGIRIVTLVTDIHAVPRAAYVGVDNRQAGRLAAYVMGRFLRGLSGGKVGLFIGSRAYRGHEEREMGFRAALAEGFPDLRIVELREMQDDTDLAHAEALALLDHHPDIVGIYNLGAGNGGIARALRERGRAREVVVIAHEATPENRALLIDGTLDAVIDQNPRVEAREALNALTAAVRDQAYAVVQPRLAIIFRENLPDE